MYEEKTYSLNNLSYFLYLYLKDLQEKYKNYTWIILYIYSYTLIYILG